MLEGLAKRLENSRWLRWVTTLLYFAVPLWIVVKVDIWRGLGLLIFMGSPFLGVFLGCRLSRFVCKRFMKTSEDLEVKLSPAFGAFGFTFLPAIFGKVGNLYFGTNIEMLALGGHFLWSCFAALLFFGIGPKKPQT